MHQSDRRNDVQGRGHTNILRQLQIETQVKYHIIFHFDTSNIDILDSTFTLIFIHKNLADSTPSVEECAT